jgi:crotonobetainyl-CoA:carnitine CoA-transferase CaiB-like acyl-CoA transferase
VEEVQHTELGPLRQVGSPISLDGCLGGSIRRAPPVLGEHTFEVLGERGYARGDIEALARDGVIVQHAQGARA